MSIFNPSPVRVFPEYARRWAGKGGAFRPHAICHTAGAVLDPKTAFDTPRHELPEYIAKFYLNVNDDFKGQVKGYIF